MEYNRLKFRKQNRDTHLMAQSIIGRVLEKLFVLLLREPAPLVGVEEQFQWIHRELSTGTESRFGFTEELIDVAYDVEDVIDLLILKAAAQGRRRGILEGFILFICDFIDQSQLHKKLELIKVKIPALPPPVVIPCARSHSADIEEIDWACSSSVQDQSLANTVVSPVIEKATALLAQEYIHPEVKKKVRRVQDKFSLMNGFLKDIEAVELDDRGMVWMEELCDISRSAVDVIGLFINRREQLKRNWGGPLMRVILALDNFLSQHEFSIQMDQLHTKLLDISARRPKIVHGDSRSREVGISFPELLQKLRERRIQLEQGVENLDFVSFDDDVHALVTRLLAGDNHFFVVSVVGMEGTGKTTLAKLIYHNDAVVNHFHYRAFGFELLKDVRKPFGEPGSSMSPEKRAQPFKAFLADKRCLIVLDDAQDQHCKSEMITALRDTSNGCRMILTSWVTELPSNLQIGSLYYGLRLRRDDESWTLFTHAMKISIPQELLKFRREIVRRCGGLPRVIVKLANALSQKEATIEEWSSVLQQLDGDQDLWSNALSRINKGLPLYMKRCLFYFGLFPKDLDIPARRLIMLWVAEGLVQPEGGNEAPEDVAERSLIKLIAQGMVQVTQKKLDGTVKTCRLPYVLQQEWLAKTQEATFLQYHAKTRSELSPSTGLIRRLVDHLDNEDVSFGHIHGDENTTSTSLKPHYQDVLSFLSFDAREGSKPGEDVGNFLHECISSSCFLLLQVLDLEHVFRPKLPKQLGKLTRLRYIGLRWTFLQMLPSSISKLQNLQTLDLKHTYIDTLPSSIWKVQQLRHLYLSESYRSKFMPRPRVGSLTSLQTLWGLFVDEETPVKNGLDRLVNIRKLSLTCRLTPSQDEAMLQQLEAVSNWVLKLNHLQSLRLKSDDADNQPWDLDLKPLSGHANLSRVYLLGRLKNPSIVSEFPESLTDLTLSGSRLTEDPMQTLDKLPNLKILRLLSKSYVGKEMLCSLGGFPKLRILKLWKLELLEEWNVEEGALQALHDLEIRSCLKLKMLPQGLRQRTLWNLKLTDMPNDFTT